MTDFFERLSGVCIVLAVVLAINAGTRLTASTFDVTGANLTDESIAAGNCANTCSLGKVGDANPCVTSATGTCVPAAGSNNTVCIGCAFAAATDQSGTVLLCSMSCNGLTKTIDSE